MIKGMKNIVVFVADFAKAEKFYKDQLRLPLVGEAQTMMEFFPGGGTTMGVALALHDDAKKLVGRHTGITLTVSDIDRFCQRLAAEGVDFAEPLEATPWGKMAVVRDADGNQFALVEG
jgi:lactoylglutathione lyase